MFNVNLKNKRLASGCSQKEVAEYLNISAQSISKWEKGDALPSIEFLPKISTLFNCSIDSLFESEVKNVDKIKEFFEMYVAVLNEKTDNKDVCDYIYQNPETILAIKDVCNCMKECESIHKSFFVSKLSCSNDDAESLFDCFVKAEMIEEFDKGKYYVVRHAVDGFFILLKAFEIIAELRRNSNT